MPVKVVGFFYFYMPMEDKLVIRESIIIIALDNLIRDYSEALETNILGPDERELAIQIINESKLMLQEKSQDPKFSNQIPRPKWNQDQ